MDFQAKHTGTSQVGFGTVADTEWQGWIVKQAGAMPPPVPLHRFSHQVHPNLSPCEIQNAKQAVLQIRNLAQVPAADDLTPALGFGGTCHARKPSGLLNDSYGFYSQ